MFVGGFLAAERCVSMSVFKFFFLGEGEAIELLLP